MAKASSSCSVSLIYLLCIASLLLLLVLLPAASQGFRSDELLEEEEEWGLVGRGSSQQQQEKVSTGGVINGSPRRFGAEQGDSSGADTKIEFRLEQAFGDSQFSEAGNFSARLKPSSRGGQALVKLRLARKPLTDNEKSAFEELVKEDGFYTIRVPANVLNPGKTFVVSSTKARCLSASNLEERFDIYMEQGNVLAIGYGAARACPFPRQLNLPSHWSFSSLIVSKTGEIASKMFSINEEINTGVGGVGEVVGEEGAQLTRLPEKSFWAKYWMYIVPMGLIVLNAITQVANVQDEPNPGPGQASGQGAGQATAQRIAGGARRR